MFYNFCPVCYSCLLSLFLFLLAIDWIMKNCESKDGIQWCLFCKAKYLGDLDFADDITLKTSNESKMQRRTNMIAETKVQRANIYWRSNT